MYMKFQDQTNFQGHVPWKARVSNLGPRQSVGLDGRLGVGRSRKPILVISAHDLTVAATQQPRQSIAAALRAWRHNHAAEFEPVVLACGDADTASLMDKTINNEIYASALAGNVDEFCWHWHPPLLELSVNAVLSKIGGLVHSRSPLSEDADQPQLANTGIAVDSGVRPT